MPSKSILLTSREPALLKTRAMLLAERGYQVAIALDHREVIELCKTHNFDLVVLGYTIPGKEKENILHTIREACGPVPALELYSGATPSTRSASHHFSMSPEDSAAKFVATIEKILQPPSPQPSPKS
jgi:CheY-like chemotaxis protein